MDIDFIVRFLIIGLAWVGFCGLVGALLAFVL